VGKIADVGSKTNNNMKYMGGKDRIANNILPIILKDRIDNQYYVEPFVGGCNVIDKVNGNRIGSDKSVYLIEMWKSLSNGEKFLNEIDKQTYDKARTEFNNKTNLYFSDSEIGWIGFMASYNGRFFDGGYNGNYKKRNYTKESIDNITKQVPNVLGVDFYCCDYKELEIPYNSIIYCDIPYKNTKQYLTSKNFNHNVFFEWCREKTKQGHKVFISEYNAPDDFKCVWSGNIKSYMKAGRSENVTEKLFTIE